MIVRSVKNTLLTIIYILYIYHISFVPLPYFLRTRVIMGAIGLVIVFWSTSFRSINKYALYILTAILSTLVPIIITSAYNRVFDHWFLQNVFLQIFYFLAAYLTILISRKFLDQNFDFRKLIKLIVIAVVVQNIIATLMFVIPPLGEALRSIQNQNELAISKMSKALKFQSRFIGLGISVFFIGGILCGYTLILTSYLIRTATKRVEALMYGAAFLFVLGTGLFIARTTIVGGIIGLIFIFWPNFSFHSMSKKRLLNPIIFTGFLIMLAIPGIFIFKYIWSSGLNTSSFNLAFELFINYFTGNGFTSRSTDHLEMMYVLPDDLKTWLIGDGKFADGNFYYMLTDVGYLRLLYYFGIIGTLFYFAPLLTSIRILWKFAENFLVKRLLLVSLAYFLILNLKGMTDINYFMYLFVCYYIFAKPSQDLKVSYA